MGQINTPTTPVEVETTISIDPLSRLLGDCRHSRQNWLAPSRAQARVRRDLRDCRRCWRWHRCCWPIALAIKLDSRGPVFYRVRRVGFRGNPLHMLKFRKMHDDAAGGPLTAGGDPRLTRVGAVLTRCRLDELPQLWDVFRGRMSVVGPRPEDPRFVDLHGDAYEHILSVRPGITGLSQLAFAEEANILEAQDIVGGLRESDPSAEDRPRHACTRRRAGCGVMSACWCGRPRPSSCASPSRSTAAPAR